MKIPIGRHNPGDQSCDCRRCIQPAEKEIEELRAELAEALDTLKAVHSPHPQPGLCPACALLGRVE